MLMTLAIILIVLWLLGMVTAHTMGGIVDVLLVISGDFPGTGDPAATSRMR
jgi:hypothetical protein